MAEIGAFRALRYSESCRPLAQLVAPPYDVISPEQRRDYLSRSPYNVVHLTLPDSEEQAARYLADWRAGGVIVEEDEPAVWWVAQDYVGPDGVARTREGFAASLRVEPYETGAVLPHERTHAGPKEGRLRLLRATRTQLEPIFLLYDAEPPVARPDRAPDLEAEEGGVATRLWRLPGADPSLDVPLLIADGHHRYETAVVFSEEDPSATHMLVVLVSSLDPGVAIFPTHRLVSRLGDVPVRDTEPDEDALLLYRGGRTYAVHHDTETDAEAVDELDAEVSGYTPSADEARAAVDRGEAEAAFLLRPVTIEQVAARAAAGGVMPQKTTFFYPKLLSGMLFHPV